ncbi:helix-turn-helix transcriptional regulator [Clostridium cadaveris]|uniref:helix-turn-helix transcriptional regulator n=1 Tax=Clostridium cadaveris TaxID=1529 RepID=UPI0039A12864
MNANLLIKFRENKKYSQEQMAKLLGYKSKASYSLIESGKTKITIDLANKLVKILGLKSKDILDIFFDN